MNHWYEDFDKFLSVFIKSGTNADETVFYFKNDINEVEHYIGFLPQYEEPYWAGLCDIENGCSFKTAEELFNAKIYDGKSIKDRWNEVVLLEIASIGIDEWAEVFGIEFD